MNWRVAEAKKRFSEMIRRAGEEPQLVYRRKELVAVVLDPARYRELEERRSAAGRTLLETTEDIRQLVAEEDYELVVPERRDRPNAFAGAR